MAQPFAPLLLRDTGVGVLTAISFAPGLRHAVLSGRHTAADGKAAATIHETRRARAGWSLPRPVEALGVGLPAGEGAFSPEGRWLYFSSDRPPATPGQPRTFRAPVRGGVIGSPMHIELSLPSGASAYYPRQLASGDLSFTSRGRAGDDDLFIARARGKDRGFTTPAPLGGDFNSAQDDWDLVESRDGRLRIWVSARTGGLGRTDLYFSRRGVVGAWSPATNLTAANSEKLETAPSLSPDGRVLFFLRRIDGKEHLHWLSLE
jgi:hypothetical protein